MPPLSKVSIPFPSPFLLKKPLFEMLTPMQKVVPADFLTLWMDFHGEFCLGLSKLATSWWDSVPMKWQTHTPGLVQGRVVQHIPNLHSFDAKRRRWQADEIHCTIGRPPWKAIHPKRKNPGTWRSTDQQDHCRKSLKIQRLRPIIYQQSSVCNFTSICICCRSQLLEKLPRW